MTEYENFVQNNLAVFKQNDMLAHSLIGMVGEYGEVISALYDNDEQLMLELGDFCYYETMFKLSGAPYIDLRTFRSCRPEISDLCKIVDYSKKRLCGDNINETPYDIIFKMIKDIYNIIEFHDYSIDEIKTINMKKIINKYK